MNQYPKGVEDASPRPFIDGAGTRAEGPGTQFGHSRKLRDMKAGQRGSGLGMGGGLEFLRGEGVQASFMAECTIASAAKTSSAMEGNALFLLLMGNEFVQLAYQGQLA